MIPSDPFTLVLSIILCLFFVLFFFGRKKNAYNLPPGPRPLPIIGNLHILDMKRPYLTMHELSKKYGPVYTLQLGVEKVVVICGLEAIKDALVNHGDGFSGRPKVALFDEIFKRQGILFASNDNWRAMRRFTLSTLRDFGMGKETIENNISEESNFLVQKFRSYKGEPFDNILNLNAAVSNIMVTILLSKRFDYEDPTLLKLVKMNNENVQLAGTPMATLYNTYPSVMRWFTNVSQKACRNMNELHAFIRETFTNQREQLDVNDQRNLIDSFLVKQREEKPNPKLYFTNENLTMLVSDLFGAGTETSTTTLRWGFLLMMKYPEIQKKVQSEIDKVIGSNAPQVIHRREMPYTDAVIHEIQRFGNIVPTNLPHATTQDVNFRGYLLPKGIQVIPLLTSVLYDKNHFVKADDFYPEHFLDSSGNFVRNEAFIPFSAGKRSCPGENLAKMELFLFFTRLLQNFTFKAPPGATLDLTPAVGFTAGPMPYKMCAIPRV
ncbi:cytochrome P450 2K1-like isoform X1 [Dendrobates tinctorius]|uniref:cytochrome P450 2K1-like isoform X1 n=1 Tax=Dendrobates tinctorius TaxID=92724 RepID=UPI003CCA1ED8